MIYKATFIGSFTTLKQCPKTDLPEYAFIGRSNVGKSSLINMLTNNSSLAHISNQPGKTQCMNYFLIDQEWHLVDLPGYGYARISKDKRKDWRSMIDSYMLKRPNLSCAFLLIDSCVPPQDIDIEFANWLGENQIPFVLVFTKTDKKKSKKNKTFVEDFATEMLKYWNALPQHFLTSAKSAAGRKEVLEFIANCNIQYNEG
ncbi:MAG: YihA family ribosome biogenesis GTP-binding protein [Aureispira sp.]|nr:YihA family ribosome biogenesis GTP-binding protein [Aureispira sp.]